jgi:hypothetical protein
MAVITRGERELRQAFAQCMLNMLAAHTTIESVTSDGYDDEPVWSVIVTRGPVTGKVEKAIQKFFDKE